MKIETINRQNSFLNQRAIMRIGKIASSAEYQMDEQFQNLIIFEILMVSQIEKILKIC